jgi:hypothetical protein
MARRRWLSGVTAALLLCPLLGGCGGDHAGGDATAPDGESIGALRQRAHQILDGYEAAAPSAPVPDDSPPPWAPDDGPAGIFVEAAKGSPTATGLTVSFTGARGPATEPCGADYHAEAIESSRALVVIVLAQPHAGDEICNSVGYPRTAEVKLARPLGERVVLEAGMGMPVPVHGALPSR